jgi:hypothetical protein
MSPYIQQTQALQTIPDGRSFSDSAVYSTPSYASVIEKLQSDKQVQATLKEQYENKSTHPSHKPGLKQALDRLTANIVAMEEYIRAGVTGRRRRCSFADFIFLNMRLLQSNSYSCCCCFSSCRSFWSYWNLLQSNFYSCSCFSS